MHSDGYKIYDQTAWHFLTFTVVGWIDIFTRQRYRDILLESMKFCQEKKELQIGGWVIMSNHVHVIWKSETFGLSNTIRDFKSFTSKEILKHIMNEPESRRDWLLHMFRFYGRRTLANKEFKIWTGSNHPEEIYSESFLKTKLDYIHNNPVRAGIVTEAEHYIYSSACDYSGEKGLIDIIVLI